MAKRLYIIGGCNGAGKTTASYTILPRILNCKHFVNADEIAKGIAPMAPNNVHVEAARIMIATIENLLAHGETFSIETTLASRTYARLVTVAQEAGYTVHLLYFWLESTRLAIERVRQRVLEGGHDIPDHVIVRRYYSGLWNLFYLYQPLVDSWYLINNSDFAGTIIAAGGKHRRKHIHDKKTYLKIQDNVGTGI